MIVGDQGEVRTFSRNGAVGRATGTQPDIRETHISHDPARRRRGIQAQAPDQDAVIWTFSTPHLRLEACEAEIALNRRTAPGIYREGPTHHPREQRQNSPWTARANSWMRWSPWPDSTRIPCSTGSPKAVGLDLARLDALADEIARFHDQAEPRPARDGAARMRAIIAMNTRSFDELDVFPPERIAALDKQLNAACKRHEKLLDTRAANGRTRLCHGDLHLRNICLFEGRPQVFDCVEFNEGAGRYRYAL